MSDFDFQPYRNFILLNGDKQWAVYTPTDALLPLQVEILAKRDQKLEKDQEIPIEHQEEQLPVLEGLRKYALGANREHIILAGKPGYGKSTALQQLQLALVAEGLVPILLQLKGSKSIPEMIQGEFRRAQQRVSLEQIDDWLLANRLVLLLDGVNEIPTDNLRRDLIDFREQNSTVPMILTTRDLALGGDLGISRRLEMKPLTVLQMQEFVGQRLPEVGRKLLEQLGDRLREIAETPLLLKMLCDVFGKTGQIPENKGELFRLFDREYEKFKVLPAVSEDFRRFKPEILQHLAFVMMTGDVSKPTEFWLTIDRGLAEREIEKFLIDRVIDPAIKAKEWLENLLEHYLLQVAVDVNQVEFHHQLFQEYYAAEKLLNMFQDCHPDVTEDKRFQHFYLNYLKWTEVILIALPLLNNKELVVKLALDIDLVFGWYLLEALQQSKSILDNYKANQQILKFRKSKKFQRRISLNLPHEKKNTYENKQQSLNFLKSNNNNYEGKESAIISLSHYKNDPKVINELNLILDDQKYDDYLQSLAIRSLSILGSPILDSHTNRILAGNDGAAKAIVAEAFGIIKYEGAIPQLLKILSENDYLVNSAVVSSLIKINLRLTFLHVKKYLLELDTAYPNLDDFNKFQASNRFLGYLLQDLKDDPCLIRDVVVNNLPNMCSEEYLVEAFNDVSDVNSIKNDRWISTAELLANVDYRPAINTILRAVRCTENQEIFHEGIESARRLSLKEAISCLISILEQPHLSLSEHEIALVAGCLSEFKLPCTLPLLSHLRNSVFKIPDINAEVPVDSTNHMTFIKYDYQVAVERVQTNCRFYNYDIFCSPPIQPQIYPPGTTINNFKGDLVAGDKVAGDKYDIPNVGNLNTGSVNIEGNQTGETK